MAINNEPTIQPRTVTGIFTNYIAKVLPLAFDDSMSYYECLCALLNYINDTIVPDINNTNDGLGELQEFYEELQSYVNNYFDNLDVQTEINNKLDEMAQDGSLTELIKNYVDPLIDSQNARITAMENTISNITNWTPIPVTSIDDMTDTNRIYLLTNTGYWYYYNGTAWTQGAEYQTISEIYDYFLISNNAIPNSKSVGEKLNNIVENDNNKFNKNDYINNYYINGSGEKVADNDFFITNIIEVNDGDIITTYYDGTPRTCENIIKVTNTGAFIERETVSHSYITISEHAYICFNVYKTKQNEEEITNVDLFSISINKPNYTLKDYKYELKAQKDINEFNKFLNDNTIQYNYLDYSNSADNYYISSTHQLIYSTNYLSTNFIKVKTGDIIYLNWFGTGSNPPILFQCWEYDENKQYIQRVTSLTNSYTATHDGYVTFNIEKRSARDNIATTVVISKNETVNQFYPYRKYIDTELPEPIKIKKEDLNNYTITFGNYNLKLFYTDDDNTYSHNWNIKELANGSNILVPSGTDILGPVKINDNSDFIGGVHGDETTDNITVSINGDNYDLEDITELTGDNLTINIKSSVYDQETHVKTFDRFITLYFTKNYVRVNNSYKVVNACNLRRATNGGLIACRNNIINNIMLNNAYFDTPPTTQQTTNSHFNTTATINTIYGSITINNLVGKENNNYTGFLNTFANENPIRNKIYFDVYKSGNYQLNVNDMIIGQFEYILS